MWREGKKLVAVARLWARGQIHFPDPEDPDASPTPDADSTTSDALAIFGVVAVGDLPAPVVHPTFYLWPCNVRAYNLWCACQTQWRVGMAGRTGLDYTGVEVVMRQQGIDRKEQRHLFASLQAMEVAAINVWVQQQSDKG